jgi:hypothetical protein
MMGFVARRANKISLSFDILRRIVSLFNEKEREREEFFHRRSRIIIVRQTPD